MRLILAAAISSALVLVTAGCGADDARDVRRPATGSPERGGPPVVGGHSPTERERRARRGADRETERDGRARSSRSGAKGRVASGEAKNVPAQDKPPNNRDGPKGKSNSSRGPRSGSDKPKQAGSGRFEPIPAPASTSCLRRASRIRNGSDRGRAMARCLHMPYAVYRRQVSSDCRKVRRVSYRACMQAAFGDF